MFYHPKSIVQLNEYELGSSLMPFEKWNVGEDLFSSLDKEHDLLDRDLRPFVEEADQMQAIQVMTSLDDAWGGFTARYLDRLRDEYGKTAVWVWGLEDGIQQTPRVSDCGFSLYLIIRSLWAYRPKLMFCPYCTCIDAQTDVLSGQTIFEALKHGTFCLGNHTTSITPCSYDTPVRKPTTLRHY